MYYIAILSNLNNNNCGIITRNLKLGISRAKVYMVAIRGKRDYVSDPKGLRRWLSLRQQSWPKLWFKARLGIFSQFLNLGPEGLEPDPPCVLRGRLGLLTLGLG